MKAKEIQELLDFISSSGLAEVNIETEQFKISVKKHAEVTAGPLTQYITAPQQMAAPQQVQQPVANQQVEAKVEKIADPAAKNIITIKSPMIGTFYRSNKPDIPPFINVGDEISVGQAVCIIEAMKLFNEIEAEISGKVVKILVENATPVEYDQPLFQIEVK